MWCALNIPRTTAKKAPIITNAANTLGATEIKIISRINPTIAKIGI